MTEVKFNLVPKPVMDAERAAFQAHIDACLRHQATGSQEDMDAVVQTMIAYGVAKEKLEAVSA